MSLLFNGFFKKVRYQTRRGGLEGRSGHTTSARPTSTRAGRKPLCDESHNPCRELVDATKLTLLLFMDKISTKIKEKRGVHLSHTYGNEHIWFEFGSNLVSGCSDDAVNVIVCHPEVFSLSHCARSREVRA